jgi:hypothetical protein
MSPRAIVTGMELDFNKHCHMQCGEYVQTHKPHTNSMAHRTVGAISLRPTGSLQGGYYYLSLKTGRWLNRAHCMPLPMSAEVIDRVHKMARRSPTSLVFGDRDNNAAILQDDADSDEDDSNEDDSDEDNDNNYDPPDHVESDGGDSDASDSNASDNASKDDDSDASDCDYSPDDGDSSTNSGDSNSNAGDLSSSSESGEQGHLPSVAEATLEEGNAGVHGDDTMPPTPLQMMTKTSVSLRKPVRRPTWCQEVDGFAATGASTTLT